MLVEENYGLVHADVRRAIERDCIAGYDLQTDALSVRCCCVEGKVHASVTSENATGVVAG